MLQRLLRHGLSFSLPRVSLRAAEAGLLGLKVWQRGCHSRAADFGCSVCLLFCEVWLGVGASG